GAQAEDREGGRRERRLARWVCDAGTTGRQRGGCFPRQHGRREVPRRDQRRNSAGFTPHLDLGVWQVRGNALDVGALGFLAVEFDEGGGIGDFAPRLRNRLSLLCRHDLRQILLCG